MKKFLRPVFTVILAIALQGCGSTREIQEEPVASDTATDSASTETAAVGQENTAANVDVNALPPGVSFAREAINATGSPLNQRVIYFGFDQSDVLSEYQDLIITHATYLSDYPDTQIQLTGHTDERGTREYNIALGERRAKAVRQLLLLQGVSASQVSIISYGEELPAAFSHDESAWSLNRRVELIYEGM